MELRYRRRRPEGRETFAVPINQHKGPPPPPEVLPWYWHPDREGAQPPPAAFAAKLREIDPDLRVCFSPVHERWLVWVMNPARRNSLCTGWQFLMLWEHPVTHEFLPLTELLFHNLFYISNQRWPNARKYYDRIQAEMEDEKSRREKAHQSRTEDRNNLIRDGMKISSAAPGNRSALHHDGTLMPGRGEAIWRQQTRKWRLPSEVLKHEDAEKEKRFYGR